MEPIDLKIKTQKSKFLLSRAVKFAEAAQRLDENDDKRKWLEQEAEQLINEAEQLNIQVKDNVRKF